MYLQGNIFEDELYSKRNKKTSKGANSVLLDEIRGKNVLDRNASHESVSVTIIFSLKKKETFMNTFSGLLHVGDIIKEVNGIPVFTPQQLMDIIRNADRSVTLKIIPTFLEHHQSSQVSHSLTQSHTSRHSFDKNGRMVSNH